ncbi:MAG: type II secretion system protein GspG [Spiribacter salinus]|uniref:Type II secretion system protein GspG n=1 Tax=Spiribacter salinus TaxID=1335746 RepID=A0A540VNQ4_9GAMM|nr:MAG: type II secretion system protein GspG [Spiribacter salinus]
MDVDKSRRAQAEQDIRTIESAMDMYKLDNFRYPTTEQGIKALVSKPDTTPEPENYEEGGYLRRVPKDPWGNRYRYRNPGEHGDIDIYSFGADGIPGGEDENADIGNWKIERNN